MTGPSSFREPARSYASSLALVALLLAGFAVDLVLGGGGAHLLGWVVAAVLVAGGDALAVRAARSRRSIELTEEVLSVGGESVAREQILGVESAPSSELPVLGRRTGEGLPRRTLGLGLRLADGRTVVVATRDPRRLRDALHIAGTRPAVRRADPADLGQLAGIDQRAGALFRDAGLDLPAIPFPVDALSESVAVLVAGHPPVGFIQLDEVDGLAHVQAFAVLPAHMRNGLGSDLLEGACTWAGEHGYGAITLCTYADVAWNGPYYRQRGFAEVAELTPGLVELRDWERDIGLDALGRRVVMRREVGSSEPSPRGS